MPVGGTLNLLTPDKSQLKKAHSMGSSTALVQIEPWDGTTEHQVKATSSAKPAKSKALAPAE